MNIKETILAAWAEKGISQNRYARDTGVSVPTVNRRFKHGMGNLYTDTAVDMLNYAGYELVAVPRGSKMPEGSIIVTRSDGARR